MRIKYPQLKIRRQTYLTQDVANAMGVGHMADDNLLIIDTRNPLHAVLRVTLSNNEVYALDMTRPQFGWYCSTVTPWPTFLSEKVDVVKTVRSFGEHVQKLDADAKAAGVSSRMFARHAKEQMTIPFHFCLTLWAKQNTSLTTMLRLGEEGFRQKKGELMGFVERQMGDVRAHAIRMGFLDLVT